MMCFCLISAIRDQSLRPTRVPTPPLLSPPSLPQLIPPLQLQPALHPTPPTPKHKKQQRRTPNSTTILERRFNRDTRTYEYRTERGWEDASHIKPKRLHEFHARHAAELAVQIDSAERDEPTVEFHRDGYTVLGNDSVLDAHTVATLYEQVTQKFNATLKSIAQRDEMELLETRGFSNFKMRQRGRYDLTLDTTFVSSSIGTPPWLSVVQSIMGSTATLQHCGCMISLPGSATQPWHSDGPHRGTAHRAAHLLNVFVPLVNITRSLGGTQLYPGSHVLYDFDIPTTSVTPLLRAGQCLLFDYRIKHRGLANQDTHARPVLYFTYASSDAVRDEENFDAKRYATLPPVPMDETREQRMTKRLATSVAI